MSLLLRTLRHVCALLLRIALLPWTLLVWLASRSSSAQRYDDQHHHRRVTAESYATFDHLALNVIRPKTEWLNMGDWTGGVEDLPSASRQLALRLYRHADIQPGAAILDVGHGCGDSLLLLLHDYAPRVLHGVTSMPAHAARARQRLEDALESQQQLQQYKTSTETEVAVHCEDAVLFVERLASEKNDVARQRYDVILALDCAYHFHTRQRFLTACQRILRPGGKVALQDLIASHPYPTLHTSSRLLPFRASDRIPPPSSALPSWRDAAKHAVLLRLTGVPSVNIIPAHVYLQHVAQAGLCNASMHDISHEMFPGFARFLRRLGTGEEAMWRGGGRVQWTALHAFGAMVDSWAQGGEHGMVRSVVVVASVKPK